MQRFDTRVWAPEDNSGHERLPGEGPSADRLGHPHPREPHTEREQRSGQPGGGGGGAVLNQDGSRLGSIQVDGTGARHPEGPRGAHRHGDHFDAAVGRTPIGGPTGTFGSEGTRRDLAPGVAGGTSAFGTPGQPGGDASNIGVQDDEINEIKGTTDVDDDMGGNSAVRFDR